MKKTIVLLVCPFFICTLHAQNVGVGIDEPKNKLQVQGNLLVTTPFAVTTIVPRADQTKTMINNGTINYGTGDSTGRFYDPGGPGGNYLPNQTANADMNGVTNCIGIELTIENINLSSGDSLIIKDYSFGDVLLAVGNLYSTPGKFILNTGTLYITFKSNSDGNVASGFSILMRRLYTAAALQPDINDYTGNSLLFDTKTGAFRSGVVGNNKFGLQSLAAGYGNEASGTNAVAMGNFTKATGYAAIALGDRTKAMSNGATALGTVTQALSSHSTAMGSNTIASAGSATAMGNNTIASGSNSLATGLRTIASGNNSTAMGSYVSTNGYEGSLIIGDNSTTTILNNATDNSFRARFDGGYRFFTSAAAINAESCQLPAGANAWVTASDVRLKEKFTLANGEDFLKKISIMPLGSWNYISQNPLRQRHYGPMAQDFYAAFGKDDHGTIGNDTTINAADFDGVNLIAIQALEKRTTIMQQRTIEENALLKKELADTKQLLLLLQKEIDALKIKRK